MKALRMMSALCAALALLAGCASSPPATPQDPCQITSSSFLWGLVGNQVEFINDSPGKIRVKTDWMGRWCDVASQGIVKLPVNFTVSQEAHIVALYWDSRGIMHTKTYGVSAYNQRPITLSGR